jgi:excisionase family DNA binding protein
MSNNSPIRVLQNRKETAVRLGLSLRTVDTLIASGKLPHFRIGGAVRLDPTEVDAVMRQRFHVAAQTTKGHSPNQ